MPKIHPITVNRHGSKHLLPLDSWSFTAEQNLAPLLTAEFAQAAHIYPIVFVKQNDEVASFVMLGLQTGKNLMLNEKNQWLVKYIPAVFRRYPFIMARVSPDKEEYAHCIDEESGLIADADGLPLFDTDGNKSETLEKALKFAEECQKQIPIGKMFIALLEELDLLSPFVINLREEEKTVKLEGLLSIDEKKMNNLSDDDFLKLRSKGVLPLIYAHLFSLRNVEMLVNRLHGPMVQPPVMDEKLPDNFTL